MVYSNFLYALLFYGHTARWKSFIFLVEGGIKIHCFIEGDAVGGGGRPKPFKAFSKDLSLHPSILVDAL